MAKFGDGGELVKCSFCGKTQKQVKKLIAGPGVYICDECVDLCMDIRRAESSDAEAPEPTSDQEMAKMKEERLAALNTARQSRREAVHRLDEAVRALQRVWNHRPAACQRDDQHDLRTDRSHGRTEHHRCLDQVRERGTYF